MSLDIHVMPLGAFWAGEYSTAAERLAERMGGPEVTRIGRAKELYPADEARRLALGVRRWVEQRTLSAEAWKDEGEIAFTEQFQFPALLAVRAFAAHCEMGKGPFELTENFEESDLLERARNLGTADFSHLIEHDGEGIYAPTNFKRPLTLVGDGMKIGSTVQLMLELAALRRELGDFPDWTQMRDGMEIVEEHPGLAWVKHGVAFLYAAGWASLQSRLPVIFDG